MSTWAAISDLPVRIESCELIPLEHRVSSAFVRKSTVVRLAGSGREGQGEDVTYEAVDQEAFQAAGPPGELPGTFTLAGFSDLLEERELFPQPPRSPASREYRRWAFESAALDLALTQAGTNLAAALSRESRPVRYVVSMGLGDPPSLDPLRRLLAQRPELAFKLDCISSWTREFMERVAETARVEVIDLKGHYSGTPVDQAPDPELYRNAAEVFSEAWIEDPLLNVSTDEVLLPHRARITWDAPFHSVDDIRALAFEPQCLNFKPSRFGRIEALLGAYDYCESRGIRAYGGGQFEMGPGRTQIQVLASLFHADAPNDVAPIGFNRGEEIETIPMSPMKVGSGVGL